MTQDFQIAAFAGDGVGHEVTPVAKTILNAAAARSGFKLTYQDLQGGAQCWRDTGHEIPPADLKKAEAADAIFLAAIGSLVPFIIAYGRDPYEWDRQDWPLALNPFGPIIMGHAPALRNTMLMIVLPALVLFFGRIIHRRFEEIQEQFSSLSTFVQENLTGVRLVRVYTQEAEQARQFSAMRVAAGESARFELLDAARATEADEAIAEVVAVSDHELRILGKSYGRTALSVWVIKDGTEDQEQRYDFLVTVKADTETLRRLLDRDPSLTGLDVRTEKGRTFLVGTAESEAALDRGRELVKAILGDRFVDLSRIAGPDMIAVDVRFAAVSVSTLKSLGFDFRVLGGDIVGATTAPECPNDDLVRRL